MVQAQAFLIGIVAGIAAALLFVAPLGGTPLAIPLFALTGLPIAIAGVGWGIVAAAAAVVAGLALCFFVASGEGAAVFALLFAMPVAWTLAAALLPRPQSAGGGWRPLGHVLAHAALAVAVGVVGIGIVVGYDPQQLTREITSALADLAASANPGSAPAPTAADFQPFVALNVMLMPASVAIIGLALVVVDLYLAEKSVSVSERVKRPHENLWTVSMPAPLSAALVVALAASFVPGDFGHVAEAIAGALGGALAMVGLAVLHAVTRGMTARTTILAVTYALFVPLSGLLVIAFALLGVVESIFHLRARRLKPRGPTAT